MENVGHANSSNPGVDPIISLRTVTSYYLNFTLVSAITGWSKTMLSKHVHVLLFNWEVCLILFPHCSLTFCCTNTKKDCLVTGLLWCTVKYTFCGFYYKTYVFFWLLPVMFNWESFYTKIWIHFQVSKVWLHASSDRFSPFFWKRLKWCSRPHRMTHFKMGFLCPAVHLFC